MIEQKTIARTSRYTEPLPLREPKAPNPTRRLRLTVSVILSVVIAGAGFLIWRTFFAVSRLPDHIITLSGRIEGDDSAIAPKTGGRILEIRVREGDSVKAGDTIATLDDQQIKAREEQATATLAEVESKAKVARDQIAVLQEQLKQIQLQTEQSKIDAEGRVRQAESELAAAEADLTRQEAAYHLALFDREAYSRLAESGDVSERQKRQAIAAAAEQAAAVAASKRHVEAARGVLTMARANLANPEIRRAAAAALRKQMTQQEAEVASISAGIERARAQLREAQANRQDLVVTAPFDGVVATRTAEPGEIVTSGTAIVTILDLSKVYLRGFVPEGQIGRIKVGQPARVYLDSSPNQHIDAFVSRIDPEAMFTPENTYFRDDRVKQVVGLKLQLKGAVGFAKPGMPADGEVLVSGSSWPQSRQVR
jgi:HlyD family secretion protein